MKIAIIGAGALGSLVGAYLSTQHQVILYGRTEHVQAINKSGLHVSGIKGEKVYPLSATTDMRGQHFHLGVIGVKSYDTEKVLSDLERQKVSFDYVSSLQNGLKDDSLINHFGTERVLGCVVDEAAKVVAPGHVCYTNNGCSYFGRFTSEKENLVKDKLAESLSETLRLSGLKADVGVNLDTVTWYKFMSANTVCVNGALDLNAAQKFINPYARSLFLRTIDEVLAVALTEKIPILPHPMLNPFFLESPEKRTELAEKTRMKYEQSSTEPHVPSLVQDLRAGKSITEADNTIGTLLKHAREHHLEAPTLEICYQIIKAREFQNRSLCR